MQIVHRISFHSSPTLRQELAALGRIVGATGFVTFEIDEDDPSWPAIQRWLLRENAFDFVSTRYSQEEIDAARWLRLNPDWHQGYPEPKDNFGYCEVTYDVTDYCRHCGIGLKQKAPFQMKHEPKWGRNGILQLNWIFDEFFVLPRIWRIVFEPYGIACRPVTNRRGVELNSVVQLVIKQEVNVETDTAEPDTCAVCRRVKYRWPTRTKFPALTNEPRNHIVKTRQFFGSGAAADKGIIISHQLARALTEAKVRGASFEPVDCD